MPYRDLIVKEFCIDPSLFLEHSLDKGRSSILFSASFSPLSYYQETLGGHVRPVFPDNKIGVKNSQKKGYCFFLYPTNAQETSLDQYKTLLLSDRDTAPAESLVKAGYQLSEKIKEWLAEFPEHPSQEQLLPYYFDLLHFLKVSEFYDDHYETLITCLY